MGGSDNICTSLLRFSGVSF